MPWDTEIEQFVYRLASASLAVEAALVIVLLVLTWTFKPHLIQSRFVVAGMIVLNVAILGDRLLAALGHPIGAVGLATVAVIGALVMVAAVQYHTTLEKIPTLAQLTAAHEQIAEAQTEAAAARAEAAAARERAAAKARQAMADCIACIETSDRQLLSIRRSIGALDG
jgi:hypothetical protein